MGNELKNLSVTDTSSSVSFSGIMNYIELYNSGSNSVFINFNGAATTSNFEIYSGETLKLYAQISTVYAICDTGLTSTINIFGTN